MPEGRSPRSATTRVQPISRYCASSAAISLRVPPMHDKCGTASSPWVARSVRTVSGV